MSTWGRRGTTKVAEKAPEPDEVTVAGYRRLCNSVELYRDSGRCGKARTCDRYGCTNRARGRIERHEWLNSERLTLTCNRARIVGISVVDRVPIICTRVLYVTEEEEAVPLDDAITAEPTWEPPTRAGAIGESVVELTVPPTFEPEKPDRVAESVTD